MNKSTPPRSFTNDPASGPSLETYVETRFNLLVESINQKIHGQDEALKATVDAAKAASLAVRAAVDAALMAADLRYQQRFEAQSDALAAAFQSQQQAMQTAFTVAEKAVQAALAAADRAVAKAEGAADKRFDALNELRQMLNDMVGNLMPRIEATQRFDAISEKIATAQKQLDGLQAERAGVKGGYGYAVGIVGFVLTLVTLGILVYRMVQP